MGVGAGWGGLPGMEGAAGPGMAGMAGGQVQFQAGLGFFPSLFGLQFVSSDRHTVVRTRCLLLLLLVVAMSEAFFRGVLFFFAL